MPQYYKFPKGEPPWNKGTGGCRRGHDPSLYIKSKGGVEFCLGCKRENNANYKKRLRGTLPPTKLPHWCECGCGGMPAKRRFLPGHSKKVGAKYDRIEGQHRYRQELRMLVLSHYGPSERAICSRCGFTDVRALTLDHLDGNGNQHRRQIKKWIYLWLKQQSFPAGYQVLCMNCQMIKATENGERPGGRPRGSPG